MSRRATYNEFGELVSRGLANRQMSQVDLANQAKSPQTVTVGYINQMMTDRTSVSPKWADLVADVLKFSAEQRIALHVAAAKSAGYKLDLTPPKSRR